MKTCRNFRVLLRPYFRLFYWCRDVTCHVSMLSLDSKLDFRLQFRLQGVLLLPNVCDRSLIRSSEKASHSTNLPSKLGHPPPGSRIRSSGDPAQSSIEHAKEIFPAEVSLLPPLAFPCTWPSQQTNSSPVPSMDPESLPLGMLSFFP